LLARTPRTARRPRTGSRPTRSPAEPRPPADAEPALHRAVCLAVLQRSPDEDNEDHDQGHGEDDDHDQDLGCELHADKPSEPALLDALERRVAPRNRRSVDQRGRRLAVSEEAVEQRAELVDRAQVDLEELTAPIVGATKPEHLEDALAAAELGLSPDELARLEDPYVPHPQRGHQSQP